MATIRKLLEEPEVTRQQALSPLVKTDKGPLIHVPVTIEQLASASVYHNTGKVFGFIPSDLVEAGLLPKNTYAKIFNKRKALAEKKLAETEMLNIEMKNGEKTKNIDLKPKHYGLLGS